MKNFNVEIRVFLNGITSIGKKTIVASDLKDATTTVLDDINNGEVAGKKITIEISEED